MTTFTHSLADSSAGVLHLLCLGDVVGRPGRQELKDRVPFLRRELGLHMVIANGENAAGGIGLTPETLRELFGAGVDVVTSGNHIWKHREIFPALDKNSFVLRPANYGADAPGKGHCVYTLPCGAKVLVINLIGRSFMEAVDCPFATVDALLARMEREEPHLAARIVDFHAEATSEKRAMAHFLAGRVTAMLGTHTHVQTADAMILPGGTASLTDLGMCGVEDSSVLGMAVEPVLARFRTALPHPFRPARGHASLNGVILEVDKNSAKALSIKIVRGKEPLENFGSSLRPS